MTIFKRQQTLGGDQPKPSQRAIDLFKVMNIKLLHQNIAQEMHSHGIFVQRKLSKKVIHWSNTHSMLLNIFLTEY